MNPPKVFISYSHDSSEHKAWVLKLATELRNVGIDVSLDQWDFKLGQDASLFMQQSITSAERVLLICSRAYVDKANSGKGGVGYEKLIVSAEVVESIDTIKFIPLIRSQTGEPAVPKFLGSRRYIDFRDDPSYSANFDDLAREILGVPTSSKPPLGKNLFSGELGRTGAARITGPTGVVQSGTRVVDEEWFNHQETIARKGLLKLGLLGNMELRFALHGEISKSQVELLDAVERSEIKTFGWPIAVTLRNIEAARPKPYDQGIRAEIPVVQPDRMSYDYWSLRRQGDFYLLQSLFEDMRTNNALYFNTRIVRITEALLFASNLYTALGVPKETRLSAKIAHGGLTGRTLSSSNPSRPVFDARKSNAAESQTELTFETGRIRESIVDHVISVAEPLFMLFDFAQFGRPVYEDIVMRFMQGQVT